MMLMTSRTTFFDVPHFLELENQHRRTRRKSELPPDSNFGLRYLESNFFQNILDEFYLLCQTSHDYEFYTKDEMSRFGFDQARKHYQQAGQARIENDIPKTLAHLKRACQVNFKDYSYSKQFSVQQHKQLLDAETWDRFTTQNRRTQHLSMQDLRRLQTDWLEHGHLARHSSQALARLANEIVPGLENHVLSAHKELLQHQSNIPKQFYHAYRAWLSDLAKTINALKLTISRAMFVRLKVADDAHDLKTDDVIVHISRFMNEKILDTPQVLPAARRGFTSETFVSFHRYIEENGDNKLRNNLLQLRWFTNTLSYPRNPLAEDGLPVTCRKYDYMLMLPSALERLIPRQLKWPKWLFRGDNFKAHFFSTRQNLLAHLKITAPAHETLSLHKINQYSPIRMLEEQEQLLRQELYLIDKQRNEITLFTDGIFASTKREFLTQWEKVLRTKQRHILTCRCSILQQITEEISRLHTSGSVTIQCDQSSRRIIENLILHIGNTLSQIPKTESIYADTVKHLNACLAMIKYHIPLDNGRILAHIPSELKKAIAFHSGRSEEEIKLLLDRIKQGHKLSDADTQYLHRVLVGLDYVIDDEASIHLLQTDYISPAIEQVRNKLKVIMANLRHKHLALSAIQMLCQDFLHWGITLKSLTYASIPELYTTTTCFVEQLLNKFILLLSSTIKQEAERDLSDSSFLPCVEHILIDIGDSEATSIGKLLTQHRQAGDVAEYLTLITNYITTKHQSLITNRYLKEASRLENGLFHLATTDPRYQPFASASVLNNVKNIQKQLRETGISDVAEFDKQSAVKLPEATKVLLGMQSHDGLTFIKTALRLMTETQLTTNKFKLLAAKSPQENLHNTTTAIANLKSTLHETVIEADLYEKASKLDNSSPNPYILTPSMRDLLADRFGQIRFFNKQYPVREPPACDIRPKAT